jgi:hypothetical protein
MNAINQGIHSRNKFIRVMSTSLLISNGAGALLGFTTAASFMTDRISDRQIAPEMVLGRTLISPVLGAMAGVASPAAIAAGLTQVMPIPPTLAVTLSYLTTAPGSFLGGIAGGFVGAVTGNVFRDYNAHFDCSTFKISGNAAPDTKPNGLALRPANRIAAAPRLLMKTA